MSVPLPLDWDSRKPPPTSSAVWEEISVVEIDCAIPLVVVVVVLSCWGELVVALVPVESMVPEVAAAVWVEVEVELVGQVDSVVE